MPLPRLDRATATSAAAAAVGLCSVCATVYSLPQLAWVGGLLAPGWAWARWTFPVITDTLAAAGSVLAVLYTGHARRFGWWLLTAMALVSWLANALHALHYARFATVWPGWPGTVLALAFAGVPTAVLVLGPHLAAYALPDAQEPEPAPEPQRAARAVVEPSPAPGLEPQPEPLAALEPPVGPGSEPVPVPIVIEQPVGGSTRDRLVVAYYGLMDDGVVEPETGEPTWQAMVERAGCGTKGYANKVKAGGALLSAYRSRRDGGLHAVH